MPKLKITVSWALAAAGLVVVLMVWPRVWLTDPTAAEFTDQSVRNPPFTGRTAPRAIPRNGSMVGPTETGSFAGSQDGWELDAKLAGLAAGKSGTELQEEATRLLRSLAKEDPIGLLAALRSRWHEFMPALDLEAIVLAEWASSDPDAAWEWAKSAAGISDQAGAVNSDPGAASDAMRRARAVVSGLLDTGAFATAGMLVVREPTEQFSFMYQVARSWAVAHVPDSLNWATSIPAGTKRMNAVAGVLETVAGDDVTLATELAQLLPEGRDTSSGLTTILRTILTKQEPAAAAAWLQAHRHRPEFDSARGYFVFLMANRGEYGMIDPVLAEIVGQDVREDAAANAVARIMAKSRPGLAFEISLKHLVRGGGQLPADVLGWARAHPAEAMGLAAGSNLAETDRERLRVAVLSEAK